MYKSHTLNTFLKLININNNIIISKKLHFVLQSYSSMYLYFRDNSPLYYIKKKPFLMAHCVLSEQSNWITNFLLIIWKQYTGTKYS